MDSNRAIPSPPSSTHGTDGIVSETSVNGSNLATECAVCPNCVKLQQEITNSIDGNNKPGRDNPGKILDTILVSQVDAPHMGIVKIIQLRRPHAKNALSQQLVHELSDEIEEIHQNAYNEAGVRSTRALVLTSAVDNVFCGGADLKERVNMSLPETRAFLSSLRSLFYRLSTLPVPTIACVSGAALGGGLELALACNLRIFARNASVGLPETSLAIVPGAGGTYRLPQVIGASRALDMILTGRRVGAEEALTMGLCNRVVPVADEDGHYLSLSPEAKRLELLDRGIVLANQVTSGGPVAVRAALGVLYGSHDALENAAYETVLGTEDRNEALRAFLEKRRPSYQGR